MSWFSLSGIPSDILSSFGSGRRRLKTEQGRTGFSEGREFRISYPLSVGETPVVLRVESPIDFVLQEQSLSVDSHGIIFEAYRDNQGAQGGSFSPIPIYCNNLMIACGAEYTRQIEITTGGTFTPSVGEQAVETIRLLTAGSTAQRATVGGESLAERGLRAGVYYLKFSRMTGSGTAQGVYNLVFEERPS